MNTRRQILNQLTSELDGEYKSRFERLVNDSLLEIKEITYDGNSDKFEAFMNKELSKVDAKKYMEIFKKNIIEINKEVMEDMDKGIEDAMKDITDEVKRADDKKWFEGKRDELSEVVRANFNTWFKTVEQYGLTYEVYQFTKTFYDQNTNQKDEEERFMAAFNNAMNEWDM
jgi:hypothetical protein